MNGPFVLTLNRFADRAFDAGFSASWQGAILVLALLAIGRLWKRMPPSVRCLLWVLVCFRMVVVASTVTVPIACLPTAKPSVIASQRHFEAFTSIPAIKLPSAQPATVPISPQFVAPPAPRLSWKAWALVLWLAGSAIFAGQALRNALRHARIVGIAQPCADGDLLSAAAEIQQTLNLRKLPRIMVTDRCRSVFTFGIARPAILLSSKSLAECDPDEWRMVLAHELAHIRRADGWLGLIPQLAQLLFYFHPLVWLACREFAIAREAACDELAIACLELRADQYGRLLLKLGTCQNGATSLLAPGVSSHFNLLRRRIEMLERTTNGSRQRLGRRTLAILSIAGVLCVAPFSLVQGQQSDNAKPAILALPPHATLAKPVNLTKFSPAHSAPSKSKSSTATAAAKKKKTTTMPTPSTVVTAKQQPRAGDFDVKLYHINYATPMRVARVVNEMLTAGSHPRGKATSDFDSRSVIVASEPSITAQIEQIIKQLDVPGPGDEKPKGISGPSVTRVMAMGYADAGNIGTVIESVYGPDSGIRMAVDQKTNSLIISASESIFKEIDVIVRNLDRPASSDRNEITHIYRLAFAKAGSLAEELRNSLTRSGNNFTVAADATTNSLIVSASPDRQALISRIINELDKQK